MVVADMSKVWTKAADRRAGHFADDRFRARRRAWLRRVWWVILAVALFLVGLMAGFGLLLQREHLGFYVGLGIGAAAAMVLGLVDSPPHYIERWRQGAEGEKATANALRRLTRDGWTLLNDIDTGRGNIDHVLVGPPGVFLLETKKLNGLLSVKRGVLSVRWREDPGDGYENRFLARRMRAAAASLAESLDRNGGDGIVVQPVVVLWGAFEQRSIQSQGVAWVRGKYLAPVLAGRPTTLSHEQRSDVAAILYSVLAGSHVD